MAKNLDEILQVVGDWGFYQKVIVAFVVVWCSYIASIANTWIFVVIVPEDYWCHVPGRALTNYTEEQWINFTIPRNENGTKDKCHHYDVYVESGEVFVNESVLQTCASWDHGQSQLNDTIGTDKGWLCEKELYSTHMLTINLAANAIGTVTLPILADAYTGRRIMFFICCFLNVVFTIPILFIDTYWAIMTCRFLAGLGFHASFQMGFIICLELIAPEKRALVSFFSFAAWTFGMCTTSLVAWLLPHWWYLVLVSTVMYTLLFALWPILPESPRFLLVRHRYDACTDIVMKIAKWNGVRGMTREFVTKELRSIPSSDDTTSLQVIIKYPRMLFISIIFSCISFMTFFCYYSLILNVSVLPSNIFLSYFIISFSEFPSNVMGWLSCHFLGRRFTSIISPLVTIPFCFAAPFFLTEPPVLITFVVVMKIFYTAGLFAIYVAVPEIFPTPIRSSVLGVVALCGMIGVSIAPYVVQLGGGTLYWIMAVFSILCVFLALPIPETVGLPLPQTFTEAVINSKLRPFSKWVHQWNKHKYQQVPTQDPDNLYQSLKDIVSSQEQEKLYPSLNDVANTFKEIEPLNRKER